MRKRISLITTSIRPQGLATTFRTLQDQTFTDYEWLTRLSVPKEKPDLAYQCNQALKEATGELVVFLQDYIQIEPTGLERMWQFHELNPEIAFTCPVGKTKTHWEKSMQVEWDWRAGRTTTDITGFNEWEIDWGACPLHLIQEAGMFCEEYDSGFGWENVDLAYRMAKRGVKFMVDKENKAVAFDHDAFEPHPFRKKPNDKLWQRRQKEIDKEFYSK